MPAVHSARGQRPCRDVSREEKVPHALRTNAPRSLPLSTPERAGDRQGLHRAHRLRDPASRLELPHSDSCSGDCTLLRDIAPRILEGVPSTFDSLANHREQILRASLGQLRRKQSISVDGNSLNFVGHGHDTRDQSKRRGASNFFNRHCALMKSDWGVSVLLTSYTICGGKAVIRRYPIWRK